MPTKSLNVLFMHMGEDNPDLTPTILERSVVFAQNYIEKLKLDENTDQSDFLIVGATRDNNGKIVDKHYIEERVKEIVITLISSATGECESNYKGLAVQLLKIIEPKSPNEDSYKDLANKLVEIIKALRISIGEKKINIEGVTKRLLDGKILTEKGLRSEYHEPFNSTTTAANLDIVIDYLSRNLQISELNLISSPEHMPRIRFLMETRIEHLIEEILAIPIDVSKEATYESIKQTQEQLERLISLRRRLSKFHKEYGFENEFKINYISSGNILDREIRVRPIPILIKDVINEIGAAGLTFSGLYPIVDNLIRNQRESIDKEGKVK